MSNLNLIKMTISGKPEYIKICESTAVAAANLAGFDMDTVYDLGVAVAEACKILTCHGNDCWCNEYEIDIELTENVFKVSLLSSPKDGIEKTGKICLDCPHEGELGIAIIKSLMDKTEFEKNQDNSKKIVMVKNLC